MPLKVGREVINGEVVTRCNGNNFAGGRPGIAKIFRKRGSRSERSRQSRPAIGFQKKASWTQAQEEWLDARET